MPTLDLSTVPWALTGWRPFAWKLRQSAETGGFLLPDHGPFQARLPGSVQENLRRAGEIPDSHIGRNSLAIAVRAKKEQFPRCGGFLIWMGHDAFPCLANTSLIEFDHRPKPAAHAIAAVFHTQPGSLP